MNDTGNAVCNSCHKQMPVLGLDLKYSNVLICFVFRVPITFTMATQLKIATLNCAGMVNGIRRATLYDVCKKLNADIILLQDTHSITTDEPKWHNKWAPVESAFNSAKDYLHRQSGVAILVNKTHLTLKNTKCDENGRILSATICQDKTAIVNIINVYAPTTSHSSQVRNDFFNSLYKY